MKSVVTDFLAFGTIALAKMASAEPSIESCKSIVEEKIVSSVLIKRHRPILLRRIGQLQKSAIPSMTENVFTL